MRSMVEGHARCFLPFIRQVSPPVPLHHLRWSPSPCRGGAAANGRFPPFVIPDLIRDPFFLRRMNGPRIKSGVTMKDGAAYCRNVAL